MHVVSLVLEAPIGSFGGVSVDERRRTATIPYKSLVVGMIANAMGLRRIHGDRIQAIDDAIEIASRIDRPGRYLEDYQTAYLGTGNPDRDERPSFVQPSMWSSLGNVQRRTFDGTLQIWKEYLSDPCVCVVVGTDDAVLAGEMSSACERPARPIFMGRKSCPVSRPIFHGAGEYVGLFDALSAIPVMDEDRKPGTSPELEVQWPARANSPINLFREERIADLRDWSTGLHVGSRLVRRGFHAFAIPAVVKEKTP